jgi:hypothetical protein
MTGAASLTAAALLTLGFSDPAKALDLSSAGQQFSKTLADEAAPCKGKITGLNLESFKGVLGCLVTALKKAAMNALVEVAKSLYDEAMNLLRTNAPAAKAKLQDLVDKLAAAFPPVRALANPILAGLGAGSAQFVDEGAKCRDRITGIDRESATGVFECLKSALSGAAVTAGVTAVQALFDEFVNLLRTNVTAAQGKLRSLVDKLAAAFPPVRALAEPVVAGLNAGSSAFVDAAAGCKGEIKGLNRESATGVFNCLKTAFSSAAKTGGTAAAQALFDEFIGLLRTKAPAAQAKLKAVADRVAQAFPPIRAVADPVIAGIGAGSSAFVEDAAKCKDSITGMNKESAMGVFNCLRIALSASMKTAEITALQAAFDEFINLLRTDASAAQAKLRTLADNLARAFAPVRALADPVIGGIDAGAASLIDQATTCREKITGINSETATGVFGCLTRALSTAGTTAGVTAVQALFDEFVGLLRTGVGQARAKLQMLVGYLAGVFPPVRTLARMVMNRINSTSETLVTAAAKCREKITGLDAETATGVFRCLAGAVRSSR